MMSAKYFEYYTIILRGAVFSWTHSSISWSRFICPDYCYYAVHAVLKLIHIFLLFILYIAVFFSVLALLVE